MKLLVLDPCNGKPDSQLFLLDVEDKRKWHRIALGYVPEVAYDSVHEELVVVETRLRSETNDRDRYWLKCYSLRNGVRSLEIEIPPRPMYAGYPGRSTRVIPSPSGRYLYALECSIHPSRFDIYRTLVHRYDRETERLEAGEPRIDSCLVDFGVLGSSEDELYFHLSCDYPSTVALGNFHSPDLELVELEKVSARESSSKETCGSWVCAPTRTLYCVSGSGCVYRLRRGEARASVFAQLPLPESNCVPLHVLRGTDETLFVGVSRTSRERSLGFVSEVWPIRLEDAVVGSPFEIPFPVMNFVVDGTGALMAGVDPYQRQLFLADPRSHEVSRILEQFGDSPGEVQLLTEPETASSRHAFS